jgi:Ca2+-binding EF-hand superfamily protein
VADLSRAELRESFDYNDSNHDERIDFAEFVALLDALEAGMSEEECRIGFSSIDSDESGSIGFEEFVAWWIAD